MNVSITKYHKQMKTSCEKQIQYYSTPETEVVALIENEVLTGSNENVGGGDDPDIPWS